MRKVLCCLWVAVGCLLTSCSSSKSALQEPKSSLLKVLSTTAMIDALVAKIGGDRVDREVLIIGEIDPHSYELVKGDDEKISGAAIVFFNGLNLEHGASLRYKIASHHQAVALGDFLLKAYPQEILSEQGQPDPHIWMDISLWSKTIPRIVEVLSAADPEGEDYYRERAEKASFELETVHGKLIEGFLAVPENRRYLVTSHDAFCYFTRAYLSTEEERLLGTWRERVAAPEGFAPDGQLGAADLQEIIDYIVAHQVPVVFPESNVSPDSLKKIVLACREKHVEVRCSSETLYGDSMGPPGEKLAGNYPGMIEYDAEVLMQQWKE